MKSVICLIAVLFSMNAQAIVSTAFHTRVVYSSTNVTTGAWVQLVASTPSGVSSISVFDSCGQTLELGVGPSGQEVSQILIFPGGGGLPLSIPPGSRVSIRAVSANCSSVNTEDDINYFLN